MKWWIECRREGRSAGQVSILREVGAPGSGQVMATTPTPPPTTPQHVKHLVILPAYLNANPGRKGQERLKESKCPLTKRHRHAPGADHLEKSIIDPL